MQSPDNHYQQMSPMNHEDVRLQPHFYGSPNRYTTPYANQESPIHHQSSFGPANPYSFEQEGSVDSSTQYLDLSPIQQRYFRSSAHPGRPTHSEQEGHFHHHIQDVEGSPVPPPSHQHNSTSPPPPDGQSDVPSTGSDVLLSPAHPAARKSTRKKGRNQVRMELNERGEAKINLDYGLHVEATQQKSTRGSHKEKPPRNATNTKTDPFNSEELDLFFFWDRKNNDLSAFKRAAFDAIRQQDNKSFASHAEKQEAAGNKLLLWATIPHSASFKASDKAKIINEGDFTRFLAQSLDPGTHQCHVSVKEIKPQKLALKAAAISKLDSSHGKRNRSDGEESDTWEASFGAVQSTDIMNAMTMILATHKPQGKITGHHEANVYINPEDPTQWMWVIHPLAGIWARAVVPKPGVAPPDAQAARTAGAANRTITPTELPAGAGLPAAGDRATVPPHHVDDIISKWNPAVGQSMPYLPSYGYLPPENLATVQTHGHAPALIPNISQHQLAPQADQVISSPVPSDDEGTFNNFLRFARIKTTCPKIQQDLDTLGVDHYCKLKHFSPSNLVEAGFKPADGRQLISCVKTYECHLNNAPVVHDHLTRRMLGACLP
ncbi:hypothetical protein PSTG_01112 [Puccinia striiformis f. sp. tritici PST-78]|uniref:Uncharacterized protein n=1 Tax=Puccinia striiformis f. sp. tritici PST-78 TaxID=1165861 RepID=A0A0L0W2H4_9BASI|nr:hypothetical protein PSTG_01112 [Puccinia striiformis f. sp. tritici PST-78]